jgi:oxygen-dependent protoporphyrinogen oxidase
LRSSGAAGRDPSQAVGASGQLRFAVVGGGISGLAAAWELVTGGDSASVTLFEPGTVGGKIRSSPFGDLAIDEGADAFITRMPAAVDLSTEVGFADRLVAPSAGRALIWSRAALHPVPGGTVLGAPAHFRPFLRSDLLSRAARARATLDLVLPRTPTGPDTSVSDLVQARFGVEVLDVLVDPIVGGINAGDTRRLSLDATTPQLAAAASTSRSLARGLSRIAGRAGGSDPADSPQPVFLAPRGGMSSLVERLSSELRSRSVRLEKTRIIAARVAPSGSGVELSWQGRGAVQERAVYDGAVIAADAASAAPIVGNASPAAARAMRLIPAASVTLLTLSYRRCDVPGIEGMDEFSGLLVPRREGMLMTACSFASNKWPHWSGTEQMVLRVSAGRWGDDRHLDLSEDELLRVLCRELRDALGVCVSPEASRVSRWPAGFPQYNVGHHERVVVIEDALARDLPAVRVAGASYHGIGVPACIESGRRAARAVAHHATLTSGAVGCG